MVFQMVTPFFEQNKTTHGISPLQGSRLGGVWNVKSGGLALYLQAEDGKNGGDATEAILQLCQLETMDG